MNIICNTQISNSIRRILECILEGSDIATFKFTHNSLYIQSSDTLMVCLCMYRIPSHHCDRYKVSTEQTVCCNINSLHHFLKKHAGGLTFVQKQNTFYCGVKSSLGQPYNEVCHEMLPTKTQKYFYVDYNSFRNWPSIQINKFIINNIILKLCLGNGYVDVAFKPDKIAFGCNCEIGHLTFDCYGKSDNKTVVENRYLIKFFKQYIQLVLSFDKCTLFMHDASPIIIYGKQHGTEMIIAIAPVLR